MATDEKPSRNEDEYFAKVNAELIKAHRVRLDSARATQERTQFLNKCPKCGVELFEKEFHHVKLDVCATCQGMWLDRGELEMLSHVKRSAVSRFVGSMFGLK